MNAGDKNTKYFHAACNKRQRVNHISKLKNDSGQWVDWQGGLKALIQSFYTDLFTVAPVEYEQVIDCVPHSISQEQNLKLNKEVSKEEVRVALFQMHPDKASGPDGMTPAFFQRHWNIVGEDIYNLTKQFFSTGNVLKGLNDTNIVINSEKEKSNSSRGAKTDSFV